MSLNDCSGNSDIIKKFGKSDADSGSPEVQIGILTKRLEVLAKHFKKFPKDKHSRRGLLKMVSKRKSLLAYLKKKSPERYKNSLQAFGLRK